jgi:hypothetical protein
LNARVGNLSVISTMGTEGVNTLNSNGKKPFESEVANELRITNTFRYKYTWATRGSTSIIICYGE